MGFTFISMTAQNLVDIFGACWTSLASWLNCSWVLLTACQTLSWYSLTKTASFSRRILKIDKEYCMSMDVKLSVISNIRIQITILHCVSGSWAFWHFAMISIFSRHSLSLLRETKLSSLGLQYDRQWFGRPFWTQQFCTGVSFPHFHRFKH